jgi:hypothetical protein
MSADVSPVPFPATMAFAHIIIKAIVASACLYILMRPTYALHIRSAIESAALLPSADAAALQSVLPGDQVGGWHVGAQDAEQRQGGSSREEDGEGAVAAAAKKGFLAWIANHFGVSRDMFMRMGVPAGAALAADIWLSGVALRHVPMSVYCI